MAESVVDYLTRKGIDPSYINRKRIWARYYPRESYGGTADQNAKLLYSLKADDAVGNPSDILKQMYNLTPQNIFATKKTEIKPVPKAVKKYVEENDPEMQFEPTQTEEEKQAYLKKSLPLIPILDGTAIQRAVKLEAYYTTQKRTAEYKQLSEEQKEEFEKLYFDRMIEISFEYVSKNLERMKSLYHKLARMGDEKGREEIGAIVQAFIDFLNFYAAEYAQKNAQLGNIMFVRPPIMRNAARLNRAQFKETAERYGFWKEKSGSLWKVIAGAAVGLLVSFIALKHFVITSEAKATYWEKATEGSDKTLERGKEVIDTTQKEPGKRGFKKSDYFR